VITNDVSDSYQYIFVITHVICNHPLYTWRPAWDNKTWIKIWQDAWKP